MFLERILVNRQEVAFANGANEEPRNGKLLHLSVTQRLVNAC